TVTLVITVNSAVGTVANTATVSTDDYDPNPANNFATTNVYATNCLSSAPNGYNEVWIGGASSDWNNAANWSGGQPPSSEDNVFVCATAQHQPALGGTAYSANLLVPAGASIDLGNSILFAYGS